jgi:hypothetical protein
MLRRALKNKLRPIAIYYRGISAAIGRELPSALCQRFEQNLDPVRQWRQVTCDPLKFSPSHAPESHPSSSFYRKLAPNSSFQ